MNGPHVSRIEKAYDASLIYVIQEDLKDVGGTFAAFDQAIRSSFANPEHTQMLTAYNRLKSDYIQVLERKEVCLTEAMYNYIDFIKSAFGAAYASDAYMANVKPFYKRANLSDSDFTNLQTLYKQEHLFLVQLNQPLDISGVKQLRGYEKKIKAQEDAIYEALRELYYDVEKLASSPQVQTAVKQTWNCFAPIPGYTGWKGWSYIGEWLLEQIDTLDDKVIARNNQYTQKQKRHS